MSFIPLASETKLTSNTISIHCAVNPVPAFEARSLAVSITALMSGVKAYGVGCGGRSLSGEAYAKEVYNTQKKSCRRSEEEKMQGTGAGHLDGYAGMACRGCQRIKDDGATIIRPAG